MCYSYDPIKKKKTTTTTTKKNKYHFLKAIALMNQVPTGLRMQKHPRLQCFESYALGVDRFS